MTESAGEGFQKLIETITSVDIDRLGHWFMQNPERIDHLAPHLAEVRRVMEAARGRHGTIVDPLEQQGCPGASELLAWLDGRLKGRRENAVRLHVGDCSVCREEVRAQAEMRSLAGSLFGLPSPELPKVRFDDYTFVRKIAGGGQGAVWLVRNQRINRLRAMKLIPKGEGAGSNADVEAEVSVMNVLPKHDNLVQLFDRLSSDREIALVMEYVAGPSLQQLLEQSGPLPTELACEYIGAIGDGLQLAHSKGVLHRDIKPDNIRLDEEMHRPILVDFGFATFADRQFDRVGSRGFMPPETLTQPAQKKSDVFSLAATLFTLLVGHPPFDVTDLNQGLREAQAGLQQPVAALAHLPMALQDCIYRSLAPDPALRSDLITFLTELRGGHRHAAAVSLKSHAGDLHRQIEVGIAVSNQPGGALSPATVDKPSGLVRLHTNDYVQIDLQVAIEGWLTVILVGSDGRVQPMKDLANRAVVGIAIRPAVRHQVAFRLAPPAGADHVVVILASSSIHRSAQEWFQYLESQLPARTTRIRQIIPLDHAVCPSDVIAYQVLTFIHEPQAPSVAKVRGQDSGAVSIRSLADTLADTGSTRQVAPRSDHIEVVVQAPPSIIDRARANLKAELSVIRQRGAVAPGPAHEHCLSLTVARGEPILVTAELDGASISPACHFWTSDGRSQTAEFLCLRQESKRHKSRVVTGRVALATGPHRVPRGHVEFPVYLSARLGLVTHRPTHEQCRAVHYRRAYVISSEVDRWRIQPYLEQLRSSGIEVPETLVETPPSQRWSSGLQKSMIDSDVAILFWSRFAEQSLWLQQEALCAISGDPGNGRMPRLIVVCLESIGQPAVPKPLRQRLLAQDREPALLTGLTAG